VQGLRALWLIAALLAASCSSDYANVPPLLKGATSGGGNGDLCELASNPRAIGYATSPELSARLSKQFPIGSPASNLQAELERQGFKLAPPPCSENPSVRRATARISDAIRLDSFPYQMDADVYWSVDSRGRVTWTAGRVSFTGI
jgi:hypothetical protein